MEENTETTAKIVRGVPFQKGDDPRRNTDGRPKGTYSLKTKIINLLKENPELEDKLIADLLAKDQALLIQLIDGRPHQSVDATSNGETLQVIVPQAVADTFNINGTNKETGGSDTE